MDIFSSIPDINGDVPEEIILPEQTDSIRRVNINGKRHYEVTTKDGVIIGAFPSITTILSETQDKTFLKKWKDRVGDAEAYKISVDATERGNVMHRLCELYCELPDSMDKHKRLQLMLETARTDDEVNQHDTRAIIVGTQLFFNFYHTGFFDNIKKGIFQEKFLWNYFIYKGEDLSYAGTVDNFSVVIENGHKKVIDFKTSKKRKPDKWIISYKKQCAAYSYAIKARYDIMPDGCEIWISNEMDNDPQCFKMNSDDIKYYFKEFMKDRRKLNQIKKETV
jgi:hypothetical protein